MKIRAKNVRTFGKFVFCCVKCGKKIVCDQQRFIEKTKDDPEEDKNISCSKCGYNHCVKEWKPRKGGFTIDLD